ncbi:MAG: hypothetical protein KDC24_10645 [Saprospiraceae bacterium]|nr:hypothetical protein [Saprospiraceae bacterium]
MEEPKWKIWLSYLMELHITSTTSELNKNLHVSLKNGRYQLCTDDAIYSYGDLYDNFYKSFKKVNWQPKAGSEALILGFGLASVPLIMELLYPQKFYFTGVEADEAVMELASEFALPYLRCPVEMRYADGYAFLMQNEEKYDFIAMDIFVNDTVPEVFEGEDFLHELKNSLNDGGLLLYNRLAATQKDKQASRDFFVGNFKPVFPQGELIDVGGNYMLINDKKFLERD